MVRMEKSRRQGWPPRGSRGVIDRILEEDRSLLKKQRHTAKRIYDRLRVEHGFDGRYTIVKGYVRERRRTWELYVPLTHPPGDAQYDFGQAKAVIGGVKQTLHYLVLYLPHNDAVLQRAGCSTPAPRPSPRFDRGHRTCGPGPCHLHHLPTQARTSLN